MRESQKEKGPHPSSAFNNLMSNMDNYIQEQAAIETFNLLGERHSLSIDTEEALPPPPPKPKKRKLTEEEKQAIKKERRKKRIQFITGKIKQMQKQRTFMTAPNVVVVQDPESEEDEDEEPQEEPEKKDLLEEYNDMLKDVCET